jgi:Leucine-rich repeat (LRR) protein
VDNKIETIEANAFEGLNNLVELILYQNNLRNINVNAFMYLNNLCFLDLKYNAIKSLTEGMLYGLTNLNRLEISYNIALNRIDDFAFNCLSNLKYLEAEALLSLKSIKKNSAVARKFSS